MCGYFAYFYQMSVSGCDFNKINCKKLLLYCQLNVYDVIQYCNTQNIYQKPIHDLINLTYKNNLAL